MSILRLFNVGTYSNKLCATASDITSGGAAGAGTLVNETVSTHGTNIGTITHEQVDSNTNLHEIDYERQIVKVRPSASPIDQIVRGMGATRKCTAVEVGNYDLGTRPIIDTMASASTAVAFTTEGAEYKATFKVSNIKMWAKSDTLIAHINADEFLHFHVFDRNTTNSTIEVLLLGPDYKTKYGTGSNAIPSLGTTVKLQRLGIALNELTARIPSMAVVPSNRTNYCQKFMTVTEMTVLENLVEKKADMDFSTYRENDLWDFRRQIESAFIFGKKSKTVDYSDDMSKALYTCDGVWEQAGKEYAFEEALTTTNANSLYEAMSNKIFSDQNGSDTKIMFAGHGLLTKMAQSADYQKQLAAKETEMVFGIRFNKIETNHGVLLIRPHELFVEKHYCDGFVLDPAFVVKEYLQPLSGKELDLDTAGIANMEHALRLQEMSTILLKNLPTHCRIDGSIML